ncbi:HAD family hydrolase [Phytomonospora endophytica]|uniref:HAD superfamily hydrolase (TIGR01490 family) n=1 Tax=Phytomonospora endophytica TaxID=714109 RepID=A0A841FQ88_9ACTN|nr:HAD-IB family hydrolase [Phytomonospora endophytica]MBB6035427.1 HAD superfamily hydrolase (TIGR01490 family) [Phytomonospora endophytica]GIG63821.1 morphological differentiation-associated protein [Phytomonospora endophytica]
MAASAAFFDLDKTVITKSSVLAFGKPLYQGGLMSRGAVLRAAYAQLVYKIAGADEDQMARTRDYLAKLCAGWPIEQVQQIVAETLHDLIDPYIYAEAAALIEEHQSAGRDVILVSASGEEMVRPIGQLLGVDDVIATRMVVADGRYTGDVETYVAGPVKAEAIAELAAERGYDLAESYAYSDSVTDVPMLEVVGHPTAVNPDRALRKVAAERDWPMVTFKHPISLRRRFANLRERPAIPTATIALGLGVVVAAGLIIYTKRRRKRLALAAGS